MALTYQFVSAKDMAAVAALVSARNGTIAALTRTWKATRTQER